jgi:hypothetical protein
MEKAICHPLQLFSSSHTGARVCIRTILTFCDVIAKESLHQFKHDQRVVAVISFSGSDFAALCPCDIATLGVDSVVCSALL